MKRLLRRRATLCDNHAREWQAARRASRYRRSTVDQRERVLKRFMAFVADTGALDPAEPLTAHVTEATVQAYLRAVWTQTPKARFEHMRFLCETVLMLAPDQHWAWLKNTVKVLRKDQCTLRQAKAEKLVPDRQAALAGAEAYVSGGRVPSTEASAIVHCRDAALVALVADTALRIGTIASLRMRRHISRQAGGWFVHVPGELTKNGQPERRRVGQRAGAVLDAYLATLPPLNPGAALWRTRTGAPLSAATLNNRFATAMRQITGLASGPQALRRAKASETVRNARGSERASMELGHPDPAMTRRHYVQATPNDVAPTAQAIVSPFA